MNSTAKIERIISDLQSLPGSSESKVDQMTINETLGDMLISMGDIVKQSQGLPWKLIAKLLRLIADVIDFFIKEDG